MKEDYYEIMEINLLCQFRRIKIYNFRPHQKWWWLSDNMS